MQAQIINAKKPRQKRLETDSVRAYLKEIGCVPLLTQEQEIVLGKQVQQMMNFLDLKDKLARHLQREPELQEWADVVFLSVAELQRSLDLGEKAKRQMIRANLRLVVNIAKKYTGRDLELLDLIQEGSLGLDRAVEKFDPTKGYKFSTYAYWWIRQAITRAIAQQARSIRLPIHVYEKLNKIKRAQREVAQLKGRKPNAGEIAEATGMSKSQVQDLLNKLPKVRSLNVRVGREEDTELGDLLQSELDTPEIRVESSDLQQSALFLLEDALTAREREVIELRYGFKTGKCLSLGEIGKQLNLSRERVRQIEQRALAKLKHPRYRSLVKEHFQ